MTNSWIFKSFTSRSINAGETGFASVQPNYPNIFNWTTANEITYDTKTEGPLIISFNKPILVSKYRILSRRDLRFPKGWNISVSFDGSDFTTIDSRTEDLCKTNITYSDKRIECGELTDRIFLIPRMTIKKIMLNLTIPGSCNTYDLHICAFDVYGTTNINEQFTYRYTRKLYMHLAFVCSIINS